MTREKNQLEHTFAEESRMRVVREMWEFLSVTKK